MGEFRKILHISTVYENGTATLPSELRSCSSVVYVRTNNNGVMILPNDDGEDE